MSVFTLGLNHSTASLDMRGRFAFSPERLAPMLLAFRDKVQRAPEAALVSTCNRTELYVGADRGMVTPALDWLAEVGGMSAPSLREHTYVLENEAAARHAFRVASGLDSMVLGEPQILGQMKQAVREADTAGTLGSTLHQMFQRSFAVAKEVRTSTEIGSHSISMAAASVRLASQLFEDLSQIKILFVGAGEMIELVATHFAARKPLGMAIANRTRERGEKLAKKIQCRTAATVRPPQPSGRVRCGDLVHRQHLADHWPWRGGTCAQGAQAPPDLHGRSGRTARHRARSQPAVGCLSLHGR